MSAVTDSSPRAARSRGSGGHRSDDAPQSDRLASTPRLWHRKKFHAPPGYRMRHRAARQDPDRDLAGQGHEGAANPGNLSESVMYVTTCFPATGGHPTASFRWSHRLRDRPPGPLGRMVHSARCSRDEHVKGKPMASPVTGCRTADPAVPVPLRRGIGRKFLFGSSCISPRNFQNMSQGSTRRP